MGNNVTLIPKQPARHSLLTNVENVVYMPMASRHSHGIVKIGNGLNITSDGLLSVDVNSEWYATIRGDVDQLKLSVQDLKTDVDTALMEVSDIDEKLSDIENGTKLISVYQTKQDSGLVTINKTVVGGINEIKNQTTLNINNLESVKNELTGVKRDYATLKYVDDLYANISMGGSKSYVFETREQFISWLDGAYKREDSFKPELLNIGDIVLIEEMGVPDYWVKSKSSPMTINDFREYEAKIDVPEVKLDEDSVTKNLNDEIQAVKLKNAFKVIDTEISYKDFQGMTYVTEQQYQELVAYGQIEVDGQTIVYDDNTIYITPDETEAQSLTFNGTSVLTSNEKFNSHVHIMVEFETDSIHAGFDCVLHPYDEAVCFVTYNVLVNGAPNFATAYLDESGHVVINVPSGLTFTNVHGKYVVYGG